jgi:uncharacterized protein YjiS (DUF1127 family)
MFALPAIKVPKAPSLVSPPFRAVSTWITRYFDRRAAMASLSEFDDCALRDIGLARSQIEAAVHGLIPAPSAAIHQRAQEREPEPILEAVPWN